VGLMMLLDIVIILVFNALIMIWNDIERYFWI